MPTDLRRLYLVNGEDLADALAKTAGGTQAVAKLPDLRGAAELLDLAGKVYEGEPGITVGELTDALKGEVAVRVPGPGGMGPARTGRIAYPKQTAESILLLIRQLREHPEENVRPPEATGDGEDEEGSRLRDPSAIIAAAKAFLTAEGMGRVISELIDELMHQPGTLRPAVDEPPGCDGDVGALVAIDAELAALTDDDVQRILMYECGKHGLDCAP